MAINVNVLGPPNECSCRIVSSQFSKKRSQSILGRVGNCKDKKVAIPLSQQVEAKIEKFRRKTISSLSLWSALFRIYKA